MYVIMISNGLGWEIYNEYPTQIKAYAELAIMLRLNLGVNWMIVKRLSSGFN